MWEVRKNSGSLFISIQYVFKEIILFSQDSTFEIKIVRLLRSLKSKNVFIKEKMCFFGYRPPFTFVF